MGNACLTETFINEQYGIFYYYNWLEINRLLHLPIPPSIDLVFARVDYFIGYPEDVVTCTPEAG